MIERPQRIGQVFAIIALLFGFSTLFASDTTNQTRTVLVLGDSLAAGYGLDGNQAYPKLLQDKINAAHLNFTVINAGLSGDTSAGGLRRIDWLLKRKIDVLFLELGGNDGLRGLPVDAMQQNLQTIIDRTRAKYPEAQIVIAGMQMPTNFGSDYARNYRQAFVDLARKNKASLVPFLLEGVGGNPELNLPDRIHPTVEGHKIVAENVWKIVGPLLKKMS